MELNAGPVSISVRGGRTTVRYDGKEFITDLGIGLPIDKAWRWSFDGSLKLSGEEEGKGRDSLGEYGYLATEYSIPAVLKSDMPVVRRELKAYSCPEPSSCRLIVETHVLEDLRGLSLEDSFHETTFNSPVLLLEEKLSFLCYTWGLIGAETSRDGGHFPEAATGSGISSIPSRLRLAGYSPQEDITTIAEKPFCPLVLYDEEERTLVVSPRNHHLISPLRTIQTPRGMGIARGLHGLVDYLPKGTNVITDLVFGQGMVETMLAWGDGMLGLSGKSRTPNLDSLLLSSIGFWNCFGGYYTELFRKMSAKDLRELAAYFRAERIPVGYFGLDLWYSYGQVGFAKSYQPDQEKYPDGLERLYEETGLPYLLHMSAFESHNDYVTRYKFAVDERSSYPLGVTLYSDLAGDFKSWGAFGIWTDFLRTQVQNSRTMRDRIDNADRWFNDLAGAFAKRDMALMMCMPTIGHYLASTAHRNVVAVRTHTDYMNHQERQVETLQARGLLRNDLPLQRSIRQNVLLSLLAHVLGLRPSYDVFLTNKAHPEGFGDPNADTEALLRAMSAGVIAIGDKAGFVDKEIVRRLCFPDGRISRPDHPPLPLVGTLQSDVLAFYTTTTVGALRWLYLAVFNVGERRAHYSLDTQELVGGSDVAVYDYFASRFLDREASDGTSLWPSLEGYLEPAQGRYYIIVPEVHGTHFLGFPDKYITVSGRQVASIDAEGDRVAVELVLPFPSVAAGPESPTDMVYAVAVQGQSAVEITARGAEILRVERRNGLQLVDFMALSESPTLEFRDPGWPV